MFVGFILVLIAYKATVVYNLLAKVEVRDHSSFYSFYNFDDFKKCF